MSATELLALRDLTFRWPKGQRDVLDIRELLLTEGEQVFLSGPSGCGKSTLLGLIAGIQQPTGGHIEISGKSLVQMGASERDRFRADNIGYIFQLFNLLPYLSVVENVTLACRFSAQRRRNALLRSSSLKREALRLLHELGITDELCLAPVSDLSVGQQQRVAAARALIGSPKLIIADEPTSALDADTRETFVSLLQHECKLQGSGLLFVSHDLNLSSCFERELKMLDINSASVNREERA